MKTAKKSSKLKKDDTRFVRVSPKLVQIERFLDTYYRWNLERNWRMTDMGTSSNMVAPLGIS